MSKKQKRQKQPQQNSAPLRRPDTNEIAVAQVTDKYSEYPSNGLTPVKLAEIFKEADAGDVLRQMELFEEMEPTPDQKERRHGARLRDHPVQ